MHWVDRGPEPPGLSSIRARYTPGWVEYRDGSRANPPSDARWRRFRNELQAAFGGLCGYCEELCRGETDHFQPKDRFPELVYAWSNWILSCPRCNQLKGDKWPTGGYVNPCAKSKPARPESFFTFDTTTGEIIPKSGLTPARYAKAQIMIENLGLNEDFHLEKRLQWLWAISETLRTNLDIQDSTLSKLVARNTELSSLARVFLAERGYPVESD